MSFGLRLSDGISIDRQGGGKMEAQIPVGRIHASGLVTVYVKEPCKFSENDAMSSFSAAALSSQQTQVVRKILRIEGERVPQNAPWLAVCIG